MNLTRYTPPPHRGLKLLFIDEHLLALDKPSGLLSVPGRGPNKQECLINRVQLEYPEALTVHRLDLGTSGIMLLARHKQAQAAIGRLFESREIEKRYQAVVCGQVLLEQGEIDLPLICDWPNRPRQMVDHQRGKPARTHYRRLAYDASQDTSRLELTPVTGRSHQLRVHLKALGHPILGDELYAPEAVRTASPRLLLHARWLAFVHPLTGQALEIDCPCPF